MGLEARFSTQRCSVVSFIPHGWGRCCLPRFHSGGGTLNQGTQGGETLTHQGSVDARAYSFLVLRRKSRGGNLPETVRDSIEDEGSCILVQKSRATGGAKRREASER